MTKQTIYFSSDGVSPVLPRGLQQHFVISPGNLRFLSITDMTCSGFETLKRLPKLRDLTLIDAGVTDCGVLEDLSLESLSLARNNIEDFSALASIRSSIRSLLRISEGLGGISPEKRISKLGYTPG
jgi:hypothetical protein